MATTPPGRISMPDSAAINADVRCARSCRSKGLASPTPAHKRPCIRSLPQKRGHQNNDRREVSDA